tara:strand:- start:1004 stop:2152 length:1149 start_codon:yes stop_codon:yes gene_type:complete
MSETNKNNSSEETPRTVPTGKGNTYDELLDVARGTNAESATEENAEETQQEVVEEQAVETEVEEKEEVANEEESVSEDTDNKEEATEEVDVEARVKELSEKEDLSDDEVKFLEDNGYEVTVEETEESKEETVEDAKTEEKEIGIPQYAKTLLNLYPGEKIENNDEAEGLLMKHLENEQNVTNQLGEIIKSNPELSDVLKDMMNNKTDFMTAITTHLDIEGSKPVPGDDNYEQYVEQKILKKQQKEQEKQRLAVLEQNKKSSAEIANSYVKEKGFDTNTRSEFFTKIDAVVQSLNQGKVDDQMLDIFFKGMNYEKDIAVAEKKGEIIGANKKIFTIKRKEQAVMPKVASNNALKAKSGQQYANDSAKKLDAFLGKSKPRTPRR